MKYTSIVALIIFLISNLSWASGGLSIDNFEKQSKANEWTSNSIYRPNITPQAPVDKFNVDLGDRKKLFVDTNIFKQSYGGNV